MDKYLNKYNKYKAYLGENATCSIADLYLSWCEYHYVTELSRSDYTLAKVII